MSFLRRSFMIAFDLTFLLDTLIQNSCRDSHVTIVIADLLH